jgi:hypothetical protein
MALSGSTDFNLTRDQIIKMALRKVGNTTPNGTEIDEASLALNVMVKLWRADGIYIWKTDWISVALTASNVILGSDGSDYECIRNHTSATANKPITGAYWRSYWKKLSTNAGAAWVTATAYTSIANPVLDSSIVGIDYQNVFLRQGDTPSDTPLTVLSREDYFALGSKATPGQPTQVYFEPKTNVEDSPSLFLYVFPDSTTKYIINVAVYKMFDDFDKGTNNPDFLQEWFQPLVDGLALEMAPEYGIFGTDYQLLERKANKSKFAAEGTDNDQGDIQFSPNLRRNG